MKLTFQHEHKSIKGLEAIDLPDFTVLTGLNGSGKSHLLEAIEERKITIEGVNDPANTGQIVRRDWTTIFQDRSDTVTSEIQIQKRDDFWQQLDFANEWGQESAKDVLRMPFFNHGIPADLGFGGYTPEQFIQLGRDDLLRIYKDSENVQAFADDVEKTRMYFESQTILRFTQNGQDPHREKIVKAIKQRTSQPLFLMSQEEFNEHFPLELVSTPLFQVNLSELFHAYQKVQDDKILKNYYLAQQSNLTEIPIEKAVSRPPWEILNELFEKSKLDFRVNHPKPPLDKPFEATLVHKVSGEPIGFDALSSGEKILISFALILYGEVNENLTTEFPKVLLLDEVDAPLHPSMTQSMLNIIEKTLVGKYGVKVILTTHSPSTVALAPENSIYTISADKHKVLKPTPQDSAIGLLTTGVPTLSVSIENRRQVFVEGPDDVEIYSKVFDVLKTTGKLEPAISLNFISAELRTGSNGSGGCEIVKATLKALQGNKSIFGIIDWDGKNESSDNLLVIGQNDRYNHENYLFEPLPMFYYALSMKLLKPEQLELNNRLTYADIKELDEITIQGCVDKMVKFFEQGGGLESLQKDPKVILSKDKIQCKAVNGFAYQVPKYFLEVDGKKFRPAWKAVLGISDNSIPHDNLQDSVIKIVFEDEHFSTLLSEDFFNIFQKIQQRNIEV
jgi:ABC-type uncharacterized transport system ATPase component